MTYRADPVAEALDRVAERTGIPQLAHRLESRDARPKRLLPAILLILVLAGLALTIHGSQFGYGVVCTTWSVSLIAQMTSPMRASRHRDERERALVRLGHLWGLAAAMVLSVSGCMWFGFASGFAASPESGVSLWMPHRPLDWFTLAFVLMAVEVNVAMLATSWALPRSSPDE